MRNWARGAAIYIVLFLIVLIFLRFFSFTAPQTEDISYDVFLQKLEKNEIKEIQIEGGLLNGVLKDDRRFRTYVPPMLTVPTGLQIEAKAGEGHLIIKGVAPKQTSAFLEFLPSMVVMLLMVGLLWFFFANNSQGGGSKVMNFGKSRAKMAKQTGPRITFADVAGLKEEKEELEELVDFLKSPKRYTMLGARIPKGVLMVGPPGTGKTYLSRATAGEAGVPFYSISGSDFVEMFVGVGASRVRDLFDEAKKNAPCIVFIDEIDAVGRKRGAGLGGGHDEREQTLNQLLVEMDGFNENQGVIVMAATNRADILDPALLRPGRFDREIHVGLPDVREREEIIKVHARNKPLADDVSFEGIARSTPGFTPADIENVMNEAALMTARERDRVIRMDVIKKAITKTIAGIEKKSRVVTEKERSITAYHEAGHAVLAKLLPDSDPVHQVTIVPRGYAGGFTLQYPEEDRNYMTKQMLEKELVVLLGGRVAEKLILGDISTGASNDLKRVTKIARAMVTKYAMSDNLGAMSYDDGEEVFIGRDFGAQREYSDNVAATIDHEIRLIVDAAYDKANSMLEAHIDKLHLVAQALLKYETINGEEFTLVFEQGMEALERHVEENKKKVEADKEKLRRQELERIEAERLRAEREKNASAPADADRAAGASDRDGAESGTSANDSAEGPTGDDARRGASADSEHERMRRDNPFGEE